MATGGARIKPVPAVRRWAAKQLFRPRYVTPPAERLALTAADGTRLHAVRLAGPPDAAMSVVIVHGITNSSRTPTVHSFAHQVSSWAHVVAVDLRGHGESGGLCTLGTKEPLDVASAVRAAHDAAPDVPVVLLGTSLGGYASLAAAARPDLLAPATLAGVIAVSAPARIEVDQPSGARLLRWCGTRRGRAFMRVVFRTRLAVGWRDPDDLGPRLGAIPPAFTIIAHDPDEPYIGARHAEEFYAAAVEPKELWWLAGAGHGGNVLTPAFARRVREELAVRVGAVG